MRGEMIELLRRVPFLRVALFYAWGILLGHAVALPKPLYYACLLFAVFLLIVSAALGLSKARLGRLWFGSRFIHCCCLSGQYPS